MDDIIRLADRIKIREGNIVYYENRINELNRMECDCVNITIRDSKNERHQFEHLTKDKLKHFMIEDYKEQIKQLKSEIYNFKIQIRYIIDKSISDN